MKKGLLVVCTMISILLQVVSFSFQSDAASPTYVGGDMHLYTGFGWSNDLILSADVFNNATDPYPSTSAVLYPVTASKEYVVDLGDRLHIYFNKTVPAGSWVYLNLYVLFQYNGTSTTSVFEEIHFNLDNPGVSDISYSVSQSYFGASTSQVAYNLQFRFFTANTLSQMIFTDFGFQMRYTPTRSGDLLASMLHETTLCYYPDTDAYGDVLEQIEQNTDQTTDAINDQTQQVTEGYDNSQIEQSNTQLADSMQDYDSQQAEITDQATGYIDDVAFVDPSSQVQLAAAITYSASWLQSLFVNLGDWGILVVVSLSLAFAFMLIGWYKYRK